MAGGLRAVCCATGPRASTASGAASGAGRDRRAGGAVTLDVRFDGRTIHVRSDRVLAPAWRLLRLRGALRRAGMGRPPLRVALRLGRLPTIMLAA